MLAFAEGEVGDNAGDLTLRRRTEGQSSINNVPRTTKLAKALADQLGRKSRGLESSADGTKSLPISQGGTRDRQEPYDNLVVTKEPPRGSLVLIDDVRTPACSCRSIGGKRCLCPIGSMRGENRLGSGSGTVLNIQIPGASSVVRRKGPNASSKEGLTQTFRSESCRAIEKLLSCWKGEVI